MKLFRGVSMDPFSLRDALLPRSPGVRFASEACCGDPHAICGSGVECDESAFNSVIGHQWQQEGVWWKTSGLSTTPSYERARSYALRHGQPLVGRIIELDTSDFELLGIRAYSVNRIATLPATPEDDEYILVAQDLRGIPEKSVVRIHEVRA